MQIQPINAVASNYLQTARTKAPFQLHTLHTVSPWRPPTGQHHVEPHVAGLHGAVSAGGSLSRAQLTKARHLEVFLSGHTYAVEAGSDESQTVALGVQELEIRRWGNSKEQK